MSDVYLEVAVPCPLRQSFHYALPAGVHADTIKPGVRVSVPFGRRTLVGVVLGIVSDAPVESVKIRAAAAILDEDPVIPGPVMSLCLWAARYYHHPVGEVMATAIPVTLRKADATSQQEELLTVTETGANLDIETLNRAPAQRRLLESIRQGPRSRDALRNDEHTSSTIRTLIQREFAEWTTRLLRDESFDPEAPLAGQPPALTGEQESALATIRTHAGTTLLFGVTGSGKTEVYLQLIAEQLAAGRQALVLVPEIGLTPQTINRFRQRFSVPVIAMHSGMTDRERLLAWHKARSGAAGVIIGTRSAIFTPLASPGLIIVDEEHDGSFKQQDGFRYSARDLAVMRGQREQVPVVLGSATPSLETWHNAASGKYGKALLTHRAGDAKPPHFALLDVRQQHLDAGLSPALIKAIRDHLEAGNQALVFINRRGFAPVLLCGQCDWLAQCRRCDARMTLHRAGRRLICHHCGSETPIPTRCPECENTEMMPVGLGTQRLETVLEDLFSPWPVIRIDRDSTRSREAMATYVERVITGEPAILVGTQMLAKGHHFPGVTLVAIVDPDAGFFSANYKSAERMAQLILQVGGRSGRAERPGDVLIQTRFPDQPLFHTLITQGYSRFADDMLLERQAHDLPPFHFHGLVRAEASDRALPERFLDEIADQMRGTRHCDVLGPVPATMERRAGRYRSQLLLSGAERRHLHAAIERVLALIDASELSRKVRWSLDVDPLDLF